MSKTFDRRESARRWLRDELTKLDRGDWSDVRLRQTPVAQWADRWLESLTDLKPKTRTGYDSLLRTQILPHLGSEPISALTPSRIQVWIGELEASGLSHSRIRQARQVLGSMCRLAVHEGLITRDPTGATRLPRQSRRRMIIITPGQLERLVSVMDEPNDLITLTLGYTGVRWGEMAAIRVRDLRADAGTIHISQSLAEIGGDLHFDTTKTHRDRIVGVPAFLVDRLRIRAKGLPTDGLLFTTKTGRPLRHSNWHSQVWKPAIEASGSPSALRPHDLRHFCASVLINSGASPVLVARQLGHSSPRVTLDVYSHLFPSELDTIAQRLDQVRLEALATHARHEAGSEPRGGDPR